VGHLIGTGNSDGGAVERGTKEAAGPLHPRSYYNRSSESLLKRVYTGLGVDSGRAPPLPPSLLSPHPRARSVHQSVLGFSQLGVLVVATPHTYGAYARTGELCVRSNAYLIVACMNSESRSTRGYEPDPS